MKTWRGDRACALLAGKTLVGRSPAATGLPETCECRETVPRRWRGPWCVPVASGDRHTPRNRTRPRSGDLYPREKGDVSMDMDKGRFAEAAVIGTGMMGPGIALVLAQVSSRVAVIGRSDASLKRAEDRLSSVLDFVVRQGLRTQDEARTLRERVWITDRLEEAVGQADVVVESISEDLAAKRDLFARLERWCTPQALL